jgi:hypothetical protein
VRKQPNIPSNTRARMNNAKEIKGNRINNATLFDENDMQ